MTERTGARSARQGERRGRRLARWTATAGVIAGGSLALAACGSSSSSSASGGGSSTPASSSTTAATTAAPQTTPAVNAPTASLGTDLYGTLPPVGTPVNGGTITQGQLNGQTPTFIFPIIPGANSSTGTFSFMTELFMPLYAGPVGAEPKVNYDLSAAAGPPVESNGGKTYTVTLKPGMKWADGQPITSQDVLFWYYLLKAGVKESPANWGQYVPGEFPEDVTSASAPTPTTVVFNLNKAYNPGFFLNNQLSDTNGGAYPLPSSVWNVSSAGGPHITDWATNPKDAKKIFDYLVKQGGSLSGFGTNPLWKDSSGPFVLKSFNTTNSSYALTPNPNYGGTPKSVADEIDVNTYTDFTSELNALKSGAIDIMVGLDPSQLAEVPALKTQGITVFGGPGWGWFGGIINFKDTADDFDKVIAQPYVRAAIDQLINQPAIIKGVYKDAAVPAYGPVPSAPTSPYTPSDAQTPPYPFDPAAAVAKLKAHGWDVVPGGTTTCASPGTAANECGAGIPKGTPIEFTWANQPEAVASTGALESEVLSSEAKQAAGIVINLQTKTFNFLVSNYNDQSPAAAKYTSDWGVNNYGGLFEDYYPTQDGVDNPGGGFNLGDYNDPQANKLINASVFSTDPTAVETEASYLTSNLPVFYLPDQDYLLAVNTQKVGGPADGWTSMTQQQWFPQYWYQVS